MLGLPLHQVDDTLVKHLGKPLFFVVRGNDDGKRQSCIIIQRRERILLASPSLRFSAPHLVMGLKKTVSEA